MEERESADLDEPIDDGISVVVVPAELSKLGERLAAKGNEFQAAFAAVKVPTAPVIPPELRENLEMAAARIDFQLSVQVKHLEQLARLALPAVKFGARHAQVFEELAALSRATQQQLETQVSRAYARIINESVASVRVGRRINRPNWRRFLKARTRFDGPSRRPSTRRTPGGRPTRRHTSRARAPARPSGKDPEPVARSRLRGCA